jgi:hypothetical protein
MGLVTVFWPLTTTGTEELVVQTGEARFVVDCSRNPVAFVGQVKITLVPKGVMVRDFSATVPLIVRLSSANFPPVM